VKLLPGVESPLRGASAETMDWVVVRENSEGEYSGLGGRNLSARGPGKEVAIQTALFTEEGCERIMRFAFELALKRERKKVTSVTKSNAQQYSSVLWDEVFARVSSEYPDVETEQWLVDAMAARFVLRPETLEVVVASNLFADILSDLGSALAGSLGVAASANLDPQRRRPSMFEPVHGSAPDIAGEGLANPVGALASAALMLEHLGLEEEARRVNRAIEATTRCWRTCLGAPSRRRAAEDMALGGPWLLESRTFAPLFTRVRGSGILRSSFAGSCIAPLL
jgi:tartrate dehydrogenase/decarboxylase/D-malate dehydrogenase